MGYFLDRFSGQSANQPRSFSTRTNPQRRGKFRPFGGSGYTTPESPPGSGIRYAPSTEPLLDFRPNLGDPNTRFVGGHFSGPDTVFDLLEEPQQSPFKRGTNAGGRDVDRAFGENTKPIEGRGGGRQVLPPEEPTGYGPNGNFTLTQWNSMTDQQRDYLTLRGWLERNLRDFEASQASAPQAQAPAPVSPIEAEFAPFDFTQTTTVPQFGVSGVPFGPQNSNATQGSTISTVSGGQSDLLNQILQAILSGGF